jgi:CRISPR-associated protein Cas2
MFVLISYDIVDNKIRGKVLRYLKDYGTRVQKSVFECNIDSNVYSDIKGELEGMINLKKDKVRFYPLCESCMKKIEISGWGEVSEDEDFTII